MSEIVILGNDLGKIFEARVGDLIAIRLAENPTTGYCWEIGSIDDRFVEFQGSDYSKTPETGIGGGGTRTFHFRAKSGGTEQIQFKLRRSWEPENRAIKHYTVNIRIQ
ncbi:protease inhibitor I42 family protein [Pseudanabaena sp. PCC 6802]|uniref:protease inhibitor I42 family protein n=1 Tax=Pseudanabaena sp. PCC 6802 TaxID=118173 RepID=UPI00034B5B19|nr:protease inhibitor I42 family protein [Pseudanabaena sp. PCC 6802]